MSGRIQRTFVTRALVSACAGVALLGAANTAAAQSRLAWLEFDGPLAEQPSPFAWLLGPDAPETLRSTINTIRRAESDRRIDGVVVRFKDAALNFSQIEEIGAALNGLREAGKSVYFFAENYSAQEVLASSFADAAIIQRGGAVIWTGIHAEEMYLADMLEWVGVKPQFLQVGDYKGAAEAMSRAEPSEYWNENIDALLDALYANQRSIVMDGRDLSAKELDQAMSEMWLADAAKAIELGIIDAAIDFPLIEQHLAELEGEEVEFVYDYAEKGESAIDVSNPFAVFNILSTQPKHKPKRETIAIVHVNGAIVDGDSQPASPFGGGASAGSRTIRNALETVRDEDLIKGVVVRIDSPGGSAIASEVIWQGLRRVAEKKPVWVSVGSMAASGGYYIAVGGERIYAAPSSIVGSIGVVGGKLSMSGLYDHLKINVTERSRGPIAGMMSSASTWNEAERKLVGDRMTEVYDLFTRRVAEGRENIDLNKVAEGRLFIGEQADDLRMIDEIGGLEVAVADLAEELGLSRYDIMDYPGPQGFEDFFESIFGGMVAAPGAAPQGSRLAAEFAATLEQLVGPAAWATIRDSANALWQVRSEPVLLTSPRTIIFR